MAEGLPQHFGAFPHRETAKKKGPETIRALVYGGAEATPRGLSRIQPL